MVGTFDSGTQAKSNADYYDITLHMYPIWTERTDGRWLYVEQSVTARPQSPYRQRVYQVLKVGNQYESRVFEMPSPADMIGAWKGGTPLDKMTPADLSEKEGCTVFIKWNEEKQAFYGSTKAKSCPSSLRGATFAESEVVLDIEKVESWDRGFDKNGKQVWGAEKGAYIFTRSTDFPD